VVYWLVFFSIVVHGISVPILNAAYKYFNVQPVHDEPVEILLLSNNEPLPANSTACPRRHAAVLNNRFSRQDGLDDELEAEEVRRAAAAATERESGFVMHRCSTHASDESELLGGGSSEMGTVTPVDSTPSSVPQQPRRDTRNIV
jgi:hypothetical protein